MEPDGASTGEHGFNEQGRIEKALSAQNP